MLTLDTSTIGSNCGKKAPLKNYGLGGNAYLTQEFSSVQSDTFNVSFDVYIDKIEDNGGYDRSSLIYIGDDSVPTNAPTGTSNERFIFMTFYDSTPGDTGDDLEIRARTSSSQTYGTTSAWTSVATGLSYDKWYTLRFELDVSGGTYDVYIDDTLVANDVSKYNGYVSSSITHISFVADSDGRGDFYIDNVFAPAAERHTLDVDVVGSGTVDIDPGESTYADATVVTLTATADPGWLFSAWSGDLVSTDNPDTVTMDGDKTVTATFTQDVYTLTTSVSGTGSGTVETNSSGPYYYGDIVKLWANASIGSTFTGWSGDLTGSTTPETLTMDGNKNVDAEFTLEPLLVDSEFNDNSTSEELRANSTCQDWYESRNDDPTLLTLNTSDVGGNSGKKAALKNYGIGSNAYLAQELSYPQTGTFNVSCDIYIDRIEDSADYDRTAYIWIGDDTGTNNPGRPCSTSNERFVYLTFYDPTPGNTGDDLELRAREYNTPAQPWATTSTWTSVATGLSYDTWYTIKLEIDFSGGTYDVYVDDVLEGNDINKYENYAGSSITDIAITVGSSEKGDFFVDNVFAPAVD